MDHSADEVRPDIEADLSDLEDPALLDLVREGHSEAYAVLFARYRHASHRLARYLSNSVDAKDIVAESFTQVFHQLREGRGPDESFRAYLFTSIRREAGRRAKAGKRVTPTDDLSRIDRPVPFGNGEYDGFEREIARSAYESLPQRWRMVLWQIDVEGIKPHELARKLGLKANTVSALAYRAREGLRKAYLEQHVTRSKVDEDSPCHDIRPRIAGLVRETAAARDQAIIETHLETCPSCMVAYRELAHVNGQLGSVTPILALSFAAPAGAGVGSIAAKATVAAKSFLAMAGSTAAIVATSVAVIQIPSQLPAAAGTVDTEIVRLVPQTRPADQEVDPSAVDPKAETARDDALENSLRDSAVPTPQPTPTAPLSEPSSGPGKVSVEVDRGQTSVSVGTPVVKAKVDVDLNHPTKPVVEVEHLVELPIKKDDVKSATDPLLGHHDDDSAEH